MPNQYRKLAIIAKKAIQGRRMTFQIADTLYYNGLIYTADNSNNFVEAIAISQALLLLQAQNRIYLLTVMKKHSISIYRRKW